MTDEEQIKNLNLRNPVLAAFLDWLVPGLGHYYQGRTAKAVLLAVCVIPLFLAGCALGTSSETGIARNVYCSWRVDDRRFFFLSQVFLGAAAVPAGLQALQLRNGQAPVFGSFMAAGKLDDRDPTGVAPTIQQIQRSLPYFELGTYFIAIAGLMNLLVIFDALEGPYVPQKEEKQTK